MTFSYDKGEPYFFLMYRDKTSTSSILDFWLQRLCFTTHNKHPDYYHDKIVTIPNNITNQVEEEEIPENLLLESVSTFIEEEELRNLMPITNEPAAGPVPTEEKDETTLKFAESIVQTIIGCKLQNLKLKIGVKGDGIKTYTEMVDEFMSDPRNQHLFNVSDHPTMLSQAYEWASELMGKK